MRLSLVLYSEVSAMCFESAVEGITMIYTPQV